MQIVNRWSAGGRAALWIAVTLAVPAAAELREEPLTPAEAVEAFELSPGLTIELVACEPQVVDPVAIRFDARGRIWVVEMGDYPTPPPASAGEPGTHRGRIKILSDRDGDGFFEQAEVFADNLLFPTGLQLFDNGAIVTLADKIVFMETTHDREGGLNGVVQQTSWFTGFADGNEQLRANHPTLTIENRVHVATGLRGGNVQSVDPRWQATAQPISLSQRDFEFDPRGGNWQPAAGNSQFGFHQDAAARRYVCSNRNPCELLMADASQVQANPLLPIAQWRVSVMPAAEQSRVFPLVDAWTTSNLHAGQFTAACGVYRYESDLLEAELGGSFFACEPTGSLVQRYRTVESGLVPVAQRGEAGPYRSLPAPRGLPGSALPMQTEPAAAPGGQRGRAAAQAPQATAGQSPPGTASPPRRRLRPRALPQHRSGPCQSHPSPRSSRSDRHGRHSQSRHQWRAPP